MMLEKRSLEFDFAMILLLEFAHDVRAHMHMPQQLTNQYFLFPRTLPKKRPFRLCLALPPHDDLPDLLDDTTLSDDTITDPPFYPPR